MYTMIEEPDLPIATEIAKPLLEVVIVEPVNREIYIRNERELSIILTITTGMAIFYIFYLFAPMF